MLVDFASHGLVRLQPRTVRVIIDGPGTKPSGTEKDFTSLSQARDVLESSAITASFDRKKLEHPDVRYRSDGPWSRLLTQLKAGRAAQVGIRYGVVADAVKDGKVKKSWDCADGFRGNHFVVASNVNADGKIRVYDPLADGKGGHVKGAQWWPGWLLHDATESYSQERNDADIRVGPFVPDIASWVSVDQVADVPPPPPPPDPEPEPTPDPDPCEEIKAMLLATQKERDLLQVALDSATHDRDAFEARVEELESELTDTRLEALARVASINALMPPEPAPDEGASGAAPDEGSDGKGDTDG
jgi:hypothetical protein